MLFLTLHEVVSDYIEIIMSMAVKPTVVVSDLAHSLARHTNLNFPDTFKSHNGMIADPKDVTMSKTFDIDKYEPESTPHHMT